VGFAFLPFVLLALSLLFWGCRAFLLAGVEGRKEGREEGRKEGRKEGREEGRKGA